MTSNTKRSAPSLLASPLWIPGKKRVQDSNMHAFMTTISREKNRAFADYKSLYEWSVTDRAGFWMSLSSFYSVIFHKPPTQVLAHDRMPGAEWFPGAMLNYAEHLLRKRDEKTAILFRGEKGQRTTLSYQALYHSVAAAQKGMVNAGITQGDRVAAFIPNCPEAIIMMLATTSLGAIWSSCSPDFGLQGVLDRFDQIKPRLLLACDGYFYSGKTIDCKKRLSAMQKQIKSIEHTVLVPFMESEPELKDLHHTTLYFDFVDHTASHVNITSVPFNHPLFIMYSSGTSGVPKCIVHGHGGTLLQHLKELSLHTDLKEEDCIFYFTTCGWMMWNWLVSSLALGATLVLYDGSPFYPKPATLMDMAADEKITIFGTSAKYIAALEKEGVKPGQTHQLDHLRTLLSTGSPLLHESFEYVYRDIKHDVCLSSISGGTDIISCFALGCPILPVYCGELQCRGLGMNVQFVDYAGQPVEGHKGELTCQSSFPNMPIGFWNDTDGEKYHSAYFQRFNNVWAHGDFGELTEHGGVIIHGRADAVLNPGGVRIGTSEIYRQVEKVSSVLESIAIAQEWKSDVRIILFVKLRSGLSLDTVLIDKIKTVIRTNTTPKHVPAKIVQVNDIPRTISGKIVELAVRDVVHGKTVANSDALANPEALEYFKNRKELNS